MKLKHDLLHQSDVARELGVTVRHSFVAGPFKAINAAMTNGNVSGIVLVAGKSVAWKIDGRWPVVPRSSLEAFKAQASLKPKAGADYLNRDQIADQLGVPRTHAALNSVWVAIREQIAESKEAGTVVVGNDQIEWKIFYSDRNRKFPYLHKHGLAVLQAAIEQEPKRAAGDDFPISRVCTFLSIPTSHPTIRLLVDRIDAAIENGARSGIAKIDSSDIPWNLVKSIWGGSSKYGGLTPHIPSSALHLIAEAAGVKMPVTVGPDAMRKSGPDLETKTTSDKHVEASNFFIENTGNTDIESNPFLTRWDVSKALGVTPRHSAVHSIFSKLDAAVKSGETQGTIDIDGQDVPWTLRKRHHGGSPAPTLPGTILQKLYAAISTLRKSNTDYLSREQAAAELGIPLGSPILLKAWTMMRLQAEEGHDYGSFEIDGELVNWRLLTSKTNGQFPYMEKSSLGAIEKVLTRGADNDHPTVLPPP